MQTEESMDLRERAAEAQRRHDRFVVQQVLLQMEDARAGTLARFHHDSQEIVGMARWSLCNKGLRAAEFEGETKAAGA